MHPSAVEPHHSRAISRPTLAEVLGWGSVVALAVLHIFATLGTSFRHGRLAVVPTYDDVTYLVDGLTRLQAFDTRGLHGLLLSFLHDPPHAPLTTLTSTLGFALTPGERYGTYLLDGTWVVLFLVLAAVLMRNLPGLIVAGLLMGFLAMPAMGSVVSEFRPDLSWGLLTGLAAMLLLRTDLANTRLSRLFMLGLLLGLDLVSKPTGFLPVLAVLGVAYLVALAASLVQRPVDRRRLVKATLTLAVGAAVLALPYFILAGREVLAYIRSVMIDDRSIWVTETGSLWDHISFYPSLGRLAAGWLWYWGVASIPVQAVWLLARERRLSPAVVRILGTIVVVTVAYIIPTVAPIQILFFGFLFYGTVIAASLYSIGWILQRLRVPPVLIAGVGALIFLLFWTPASKNFDAENPNVAATDAANRAIAPAVLEAIGARDRSKAPPLVLNVSPGPIALHILQYYAMLQNIPGRFQGIYHVQDWDSLLKIINAADVNVVSEKGAMGQSPANFPVYAYIGRIIEALRSDPNWHVVATFTDASGHHTLVFARTAIGQPAL